MSSLKKISILSALLVSMSIVGYGATVVVPRVPVVRVPTSRPTVNTPKPSVTKSTPNTGNKSSNTTNNSNTTRPSESRSSTVEKNFNDSGERSSFFNSFGGAFTGSWLYNSLFNHSSNSSNGDTNSNAEDTQSCGIWDWITNNIEYLKRVLLGES